MSLAADALVQAALAVVAREGTRGATTRRIAEAAGVSEVTLFRHFEDAERECGALLEKRLALPAYDQCIKASHRFNLLDARGAISVAERAAYIGRVRTLAKGCCEAWLAGEGG